MSEMNESQQHGLQLLNNLNVQRKNNGASFDLEIKILIDEKAFLLPVHKFLVSACCPYIRSCLDNMPESNKRKKVSTIDLSRLNGESVAEIINWIYTGVCNLTAKTAQDILISADFLCIDDIVRLSTSFISCSLTYENCSDMYKLSYSCETYKFRERVRAYIVRNFYPLLSKSHLNGLPLEDIFDLSSSDDLILFSHKFIDLNPADHEFKLFQIIKDYLEANNLQDFWFDVLIKSIRVIHLTMNQINDLIKDQRWLGNCTKKGECIDLLKDVLANNGQNSLDFKYQIPLAPRTHLKGFKYVNSGFSSRHDMFKPSIFTTIVPFNDLDSEQERMKNTESLVMIRGMKIFLTKWDDLLAIGGFQVTYTDGTEYTHGLNKDLSFGVYEFQLKDGEFINRLEYQHYQVIHVLTFHTNFKNIYGPYGKKDLEKGGFCNFVAPQRHGFLAAVAGEVSSNRFRNKPIIVFMKFFWGVPNKELKMYFG